MKFSKAGDCMGKIMILTFEDAEEKIIDSILSVIDTGVVKYNAINSSMTQQLKFGDLYVDTSRRLIIRNEKEIALTFIEFEILHLLARNPGKVFSKEQIYDIVWKEPYSGDYNIVMSHIRNIREKIEDNPGKPVYIQTVWGVGYRFSQNMSSGL